MKITRGGNSFELWQQRLAGFSLAWWLVLAPRAAHNLWLPLVGGKMPPQLSTLLDLWPMWAFGAATLALAALSTDFSERTVAQRLARWFLLGICALPILFAL